MMVQGVVNYFTDSTGFRVHSQLDPTPSSLPTQDEEEELLRLMRAPTKEELRQLVQEIKKNVAQNSPLTSDNILVRSLGQRQTNWLKADPPRDERRTMNSKKVKASVLFFMILGVVYRLYMGGEKKITYLVFRVSICPSEIDISMVKYHI
ncbi:hypothetical protein L6452_35958 [Arctium lappa]|uniref:Uncharacterized protein n=1 Tax=Arctium lappa TaxID=4217 RepID=A0ACB8YC30_ARCLA|nr:hypothetical protein L6452_35958 [Arctium lappa]